MNVIAILGPTASGKSSAAMHLARKYNGEIVGCDAFQIYRGMDIGTAKSSTQERAEIPHHMIDIISPDETYTAARYSNDALQCIHNINSRGKVAIVCGGTGFYWRSLYRGISDAPTGNDELRARLERLDNDTLHAKLAAIDQISADRIPLGNKRRIIRALEVFELSDKPFSQFQAHGEPRFDAKIYAIDLEREELYNRINSRVDSMVSGGLLDEISSLLNS